MPPRPDRDPPSNLTEFPVLVAHDLSVDLANQRLRKGGEEVLLRPKSFAVLRYLMEHPGRLVPKQELLSAVWPDTRISPAVLKVCVSELRQALGDEVKEPRFIRTAGRLGYWFIAPVAATVPSTPTLPLLTPGRPRRDSALVGRQEEISLLWDGLERALEGVRQVVFISGEAGIGKTSLVGAFLDMHQAKSGIRVAIGQSAERRVAGESYLPVLGALSDLCRRPGGDEAVALLRRRAPTWLLHLPALVEPADQEKLRRETIGATPERMLREMAEALEALTVEVPLMLVLEDLHWADASTLDLLSYLARGRQRARLLVMGLYRPDDALQEGHPVGGLVRELLVQRCCVALPLRSFSAEEVLSYLKGRLGVGRLPPSMAQELAAAMWRRTGGNPLFLANLFEELAARLAPPAQGAPDPSTAQEGPIDGQRWLLEVDRVVPESLRLVLEQRLGRLDPDELRVLEAASLIDEDFAAEAVAAALPLDTSAVEEICERLARRRTFIATQGLAEWPDGTVCGRYRLLHALYRDALSDRVAPLRQVHYHHRLASRLERGYGERADEVAGDLALHFERGRVPARAVHYLQRAARVHSGRYANREAAAALTHALSLLPQVPEPERTRLHLEVRQQRAMVYRSMGNISASLEEFGALAAAAEKAGEIGRQLQALLYIANDLSWFDTARSVSTLEGALVLGRALGDEGLSLQVRGYLGFVRATQQRWSDEDADACIAAQVSARDAGEGVFAWYGRASHLMLLRAEYQVAKTLAQDGMERALRDSSITEYLARHVDLAAAHFHLGELGSAIEVENRGLEIAEKNGQHMWSLVLRICQALAYAEACDLVRARDLGEAILAYLLQAAGSLQVPLEMIRSVLGLVYVRLGEPERARQHLQAVSVAGLEWSVSGTRHYALSECWLALGDADRARTEADAVIAGRTPSGEVTMISMAWRVRARAALLEGRWKAAEEEIEKALAVIGGREAPVAAWRALATAAEIRGHAERPIEARRCRQESAVIVRRIADGLRGHEEARQAFLTNQEIRSILSD